MMPVVHPRIVVLPSFYPMEYHYTRGNFFEEQTRLLRKNGSDIAVVFNENRSLASFSLKKFRYVHFQRQYNVERDIPVFRRLAWNIIPTRYALGSRLWVRDSIKLTNAYIDEQGKPDLFHVHCAFDAGSVALHFKRKLKIPYIITEHSSFFLLSAISDDQKRRALDIYNNAERVIVVSESFRDALIARLSFEKHRVEVIPNFIDTDYFRPVTDIVSQPPGEEKVLFTVCHHTHNKRLDRLLHAFQKVVSVYAHWRLIIGGAGAETNNLKSLTSQLGLQDKVKFTGSLSKEQVRNNMNNADLYVLSSDAETFGVVLIEAMAMGLPVVATSCGGPSDIVTRETGLLAECSNEGLAEKLIQLISNYGDYNRDKIRTYAVDNYSGNVVAARYENIYNQSGQINEPAKK